MKDYKKYYTLPASPEDVYLALTIPQSIKLWTGAEAEMSEEVGTEFSLFDGDIVGKNLEFEYGKKIVQQWYFDGQEEDSVVTIKLHEHKSGCSVELRHSNIPDEVYDEFVEGWDDNYFGELREFFEEED
ncbi:ATPase [Pelobium manganitolerans]|uniref:ATPase n=1 Tax=Pelobium manganitolerans TaxID=1842495 RepID=A0A419S410_9SPHI|nr:SRPBCC domain-containing protein [Pelobium manganitolerans]RKD14352.1 ATPase [Pelobium manganitolerans]